MTSTTIEQQLDELIDQYGRDLRKRLDDGSYRDDDDTDLANYALGALFAYSDDSRYASDEATALAHLITTKLEDELVGTVLDETDPRSERVVQEVAANLRLTIADQNNVYGAIHYLIRDAIVEQADTIRLARSATTEPSGKFPEPVWRTYTGAVYASVREIPCMVIANGYLLDAAGDLISEDHPDVVAEIERRGRETYRDHGYGSGHRDATGQQIPIAGCHHP
ncbi:MAG: hypothetical protein ACRDT2_06495 [Natronosporangium sp.]